MKLLKILAIFGLFLAPCNSFSTVTALYTHITIPTPRVINCLAISASDSDTTAQQVAEFSEWITSERPLDPVVKFYSTEDPLAIGTDLLIAEQSHNAFKDKNNFIPRIVDELKSKNIDTELVAFPDPEESELDYWSTDTMETEAHKIRQMYDAIEKDIPAIFKNDFYDVCNDFEAHISAFKRIANKTEKELWINNYSQLSRSLFGFKLLTHILQTTENKKIRRIHICAHEKHIEFIHNSFKKLVNMPPVTEFTYKQMDDTEYEKLQRFIGNEVQLPKRRSANLNHDLNKAENRIIAQITNFDSINNLGDKNENN